MPLDNRIREKLDINSPISHLPREWKVMDFMLFSPDKEITLLDGEMERSRVKD